MSLTTDNAARRKARLLPTGGRTFGPFCDQDFENWAWHCVRIRDKMTGEQVRFRLNRPQRRVLGLMEGQRRSGRPIRLIMLKARQWGGSTLVQIYMAWLQIVHRRNWHSIICAHDQGASRNIRGMLTQVLARYPLEHWPCEQAPALKRYEGSANTLYITGRDCRVTLASAQNPESTRGLDVSMAHLSEVAFYPDTPMRTPGDLVRAVCSGIPPQPFTFVALESTANGQGNYFHREWLRAEQGHSDKAPVFVPWHEIDMYELPLGQTSPEELWASLTPYEQALWHDVPDITLEQLNWYHTTALQYDQHVSMMREYPTTAAEAFESTGNRVFAAAGVEALRSGCREPLAVGEVECRTVQSLRGPAFTACAAGGAKIWEWPDASARPGDYVAGVDVGGRGDKADWSVVSVIDTRGPRPRVVAQWRGHTDMDLLAWKAMAMAALYARALLVFESNTLESDRADEGAYVLRLLAQTYPNLYRRATPQGAQAVGFHTNRATKGALVAQMVAMVRDGAYVERDHDACKELSEYQRQPNGSYAARSGCHDDIVMSRAIALYVAAQRGAAAGGPVLHPIASRPHW